MISIFGWINNIPIIGSSKSSRIGSVIEMLNVCFFEIPLVGKIKKNNLSTGVLKKFDLIGFVPKILNMYFFETPLMMDVGL